jgi:uncharacterized protein DUF6176
MDHVCLTIPVLAGQGQSARSFMADLEDSQREAYAASEQRIGIQKELWFISDLGEQELLVAYMESGDFGRAFEQFVASRDSFDLWFKERLANVTGLDLNDPPELQLPELLSHYEGAARMEGVAQP